MPFNQRIKVVEAIKGSTIHQSLATPSSEVSKDVKFRQNHVVYSSKKSLCFTDSQIPLTYPSLLLAGEELKIAP